MRLLLLGATGFLGRHITDRATGSATEPAAEPATGSSAGRAVGHDARYASGHDAGSAAGRVAEHVAGRAVGHDVGRAVGHAVGFSVGYEIVGVSRRAGAADLRLDPVADPGGLAEALRSVRPDVVVNCGGALDGDPAELVEGNVTAVSRLVEAVREQGCRLVHVGSAAEYGRVPEGVPVTEAARPRPVGVYGVTKLAGTALALTLPDAVVLRVFNPIGPGASPPSLLGGVTAQLAAGRREIRTGPLDATRDYVDVRDVADAVLAAAASTARGVLNVGSGRPTHSRTLLHTLLSLLSGCTLTEVPGGSPRSPSVPWQQADLTATTAALPWKPATPLRTTLQDLLREAGC